MINVFTNLFLLVFHWGANVLAARFYAAGKAEGDVRNGTYVCDTGFGQWCGDGAVGLVFFKMGTGGYGNACGCD